MKNLINYLKIHRGDFIRAIIAAAIFFALASFISSPVWRAVWFTVTSMILVLIHFYTGISAGDSFHELKQEVDEMTEGNLRILKSTQRSTDPDMQDFGTSLLLLNSRLRQIVEKVKNVSGSVGQTSENIVQLSRVLLKSGQGQSQASENASRAMADINVAIKRLAQGAIELNELGITVSSATLQLTASIEEVTRNALQVGEFAKDTQVSMEKMVHGTREIEEASRMLHRASEEADTALQNMQRRIREVSEGITKSDELAERAAAAARSGGSVVDDVQSGMENIATTFQNASTVIENLALRSEQIGEILTVITQVADQTNLLSLNAAILSAQAGVHGKGFAVVADEIRKLSNRTASSVREIEQVISKVREEIHAAVDLMEAGKMRVAEGLERSSKASEALSEILTSSTASRDQVAAMAESTRAQAVAEKEVQQANLTIKQRLDQISEVIGEQTQVSNQVYSKAERMIDLLKNVEKGMEEQTRGAKEVSKIAERLSEIIQNIHSAINEQTITSSQVVQAVDRLRSAVQSGTATIRSLNATAQSLDQESFILKHELARFRLPEAKRGGALRIGMTGKVSSGMLDPAYSQYVFLVDVLYNFYEGLVEFGEGTDIQPVLAERWDISEDGLLYTFHLKRGVRFHNGRELTAQDVKNSFERLMHPALKSPGTWMFEGVIGVAEYQKGQARDISGFCVVNPTTLTIRMNQPMPYFLGMITHPFASVLPPELSNKRSVITDVCGTGPFKLDHFVPEQRIEMSRFEGYHSPPLPHVDRVTIQMGMDEFQLADQMESGAIDFTHELQKQTLARFISRPEWRPRLETNVQLYTAFLAMSCDMRPTNDIRVRKAIAYAIDRERIVREVVGTERAIVARTLLPPGLPGHDPNASGYSYDPDRARDLLRQAGIAEGTTLEDWHGEAASNRDVLQIVQENLNAVGLNLQIRNYPSASFQKEVDRGTVPMRMTRWVADYPDPDNFLYVTFHSKSPVFNLGFRSPEFDRLTEEARSLADIQERIRLYQRSERILLEQSPCIVLYHNRALVLHQENVQGCIPHFTQPVIRYKKAWFS
ncbi:MAG: hypothetical protein C5B54_08140 [Acidobacteria bacterium]|nr:MAG: hypothetical protein C5B54_08140 [Acidobacteriota bacterium]